MQLSFVIDRYIINPKADEKHESTRTDLHRHNAYEADRAEKKPSKSYMLRLPLVPCFDTAGRTRAVPEKRFIAHHMMTIDPGKDGPRIQTRLQAAAFDASKMTEETARLLIRYSVEAD